MLEDGSQRNHRQAIGPVNENICPCNHILGITRYENIGWRAISLMFLNRDSKSDLTVKTLLQRSIVAGKLELMLPFQL